MSLPLYESSAPTRFNATQHNTGLWYDKFVNVWASGWAMREGSKLEWVKSVAGQHAGDKDQLEMFAKRQQDLAEKLRGKSIAMMTATRFATGLGREHPIEIGFAWHHTLGTPYLPGSGVKGVLRAYVRECFGKEVASDLFGPDDFKAEHCVGKWFFLDAIPTKPVLLEADVMTPHYGPYYQGDAAPGDWHNPIPIPFLAVAREQHFQFAFAPRHPGDTGKDANGNAVTNDTIAEWLTAALHWLGAGAKTNSGFGVFRRAGEPSSQPVSGTVLSAGSTPIATKSNPLSPTPTSNAPGQRRSFKATLELVTPAFLAGADQKDPTDCDLRPATLRGQLRYWWRTLHAGYLTVEELRALEAAIWGSTNGAGAIRVVVEPVKRTQAQLFDFRDGFAIREDFRRAHDIVRPVVPPPDQAPLTQGLFYAAYGMNDGGKQRYFLTPGAVWKVQTVAKSSEYEGHSLSSQQALEQAQSALSLFCRYGGVGAKARKGFGSLTPVAMEDASGSQFTDRNDAECTQHAEELRQSIGIARPFDEVRVQSSAIHQMLELQPLVVSTTWKDCWFLLDQLGASFQAFAQASESTHHGKHCEEKVALGLPRQIHSPKRGKMRHQERSGQHRAPKRLPGPERHAAPIHYHVSPGKTGLVIRVAAFPAARLPDLTSSRNMLSQLLTHLKDALQFELTNEQLIARLEQLKPGEVLLRVESRSGNTAEVKAMFPAPQTPSGIRNEGQWSIAELPTQTTGSIMVVLGYREPGSTVKKAKFVETVGKLPPAPPQSLNGRGLNSKGPRR